MSDVFFHGDSPFPDFDLTPAAHSREYSNYDDAIAYYNANREQVNQLVSNINSEQKHDAYKIMQFEQAYKGKIKQIHNYYESDGFFGKMKSMLAPWFASWFEPALAGLQEDVVKLSELRRQLAPFGSTRDMLNTLMENNQDSSKAKTDLEISTLLQKDLSSFCANVTINDIKLESVKKGRSYNNDPNWQNYLPQEIKQFLNQRDQQKLAALCFTQALFILVGGHLREELNATLPFQGDGNYEAKYFEEKGSKFLEIKCGYKETKCDGDGFIDYTGRVIAATTKINLSNMNAPVIFSKEIR